MIEARRRIGNVESVETRFYISSVENDAKFIMESARAHWGVENSAHWVLDVAFREDEARNRIGHSAENLAIIRKLAFNPLELEKTAKPAPAQAGGWGRHQAQEGSLGRRLPLQGHLGPLR